MSRRGWYEGLSKAFLGFKGPKVLMLAGTDRLDRELTIGQMQGRFQMVVLPQASLLVSTHSSALSAGMTVSFDTFALLQIGQLAQRFSHADECHSLCKPAVKQASCSRAWLIRAMRGVVAL